MPSKLRLREPDRVEFFSDSVIAIAATLLSADLKAPRTDDLQGLSLAEALTEQWPSYLAFVVSFVFIGIAWAAHHNMFTYIQRADHLLLIVNLLFLLTIAVQPYSTALMAEHLGQPDERTAALVYYSVLFAMSLSYNFVWQYAMRRGLIEEGLDRRLLIALSLEYAVAPLLHGAALVCAMWSVKLSIIPVVVLYIFFALPRVSETWHARTHAT